MTIDSGIPITRPKPFILQIHVTERCNLRCAHCYQSDSLSREMSLEQITGVVNQFQVICSAQKYIGQLTLTGGEPFVRSDFLEMLEKIASQYPSMRLAILTNGSLLTNEITSRLAKLHPAFVQVSIDGSENTHDHIRGTGSYGCALRGLEYLRANGIFSLVSFTAHRDNYREFPLVVEAARRVGAARVWTDRLAPFGRAEHLQILTPSQTQEFFNIVHEEQLLCAQYEGVTTQITMRRSLQFLVTGGRPYRCSAGRRLLAMMPDGLVYPCRRLPIPIANVLSVPLWEIRQRACKVIRKGNPCPSCPHAATCSGGSRCLTYATTGNILSPDPGCWLC